MSENLITRFDPTAKRTVSLAGTVAIVLVSVVVAFAPWPGVMLAGGLAAAALAVGLHVNGILSPLWPLVVVGGFMPLNGIRPIEFAAVGDLMLMGLGLAALLVVRRARPPVHVVIVLIGTFLVTAGGIIGMMATQDWGGSIQMVRFILGAPMVIVILMLVNPSKAIATLLLTAYAFGACVSTYSGMFQEVDPAFGRASGLGIHVGHLALAAQLGFFVWIGWIVAGRTLLIKGLATFAAALCLYGVLLTGTRTALLGLVLGLGVFALALGIRGILAMAGAALSAVLAYFLVVPYLPNSDNIYRALGMSDQAAQSDGEHMQAFQVALREIGEHPWSGWGFGQGQEAHNLILQIANLGGLVGLIGFFVIWTPIFLMLVQRVAHGVDRESAMAVATFCGVLAYFVFAMFQPLIWDRHLWFFIVLTLYLQHPFNKPWPQRRDRDHREEEEPRELEAV